MKQKLIISILLSLMALLFYQCKKDETDQKIPQVTPQDSKTQENAMKAAYHIFEQVVPIENESIQSVECDTANKKYSLTFSGEVPEIKTGNVVVVRDGDEPRIILVKDANISGNTVNIEGNLGDYSFVFYDTSFALSCAPQMFEQQHPDVTVYRPEPTSLTKSDKVTVDIDMPTWEIGDNDFSFDGGFDIKHKIDKNGIINLTNKIHIGGAYWVLLDFKKREDVYIDGVWYEQSHDVDWDYEIYFDKCSIKNSIKLGVTGKVDLIKQEHELIKSLPPLKCWFSVGIVPVRMLFGVDVLKDFKVSTSATISFDLSTELIYSQQLGIFKTEDGRLHFTHTKPMVETKVTPTLNGNAELSFTGSIYPVFYFSLYSKSVGGGGLALKPTLSAKAGVGATIGGDDDLVTKAGVGASAVVGVKAEVGYYREKMFKEENESAIQFTAPALKEKIPFFTSEPIETFLENAEMSRDDNFYHLDTEIDIIDLAAWKAPSKLALMSVSDENHSETFISDEELSKNQEVSIKGNGGTSWGLIDDTDFYYPIHKGVPIKAHYKVMSELLVDLAFKQWRWYFNTPFPNMVMFRSKYDKELRDTKNIIGYDFEYEWTPKEDDDYLEAFVYDYTGKQKGYVKINPVNISAKLSADKVNENDECYVSGEIVAGHSEYDFTVLVDGKVIKTVKKTGKYKIQLPTNVQGEHSGFVRAMNNGISVAERPFTYTVIDANTNVKPSDGSVTLPDLPGEDL